MATGRETEGRDIDEAVRARLKFGLAGWSYPDWKGTFYPRRDSSTREFSELRYAARLFDCLEINSTFYRVPEPRTTANWVRQVEDLEGFTFTAKLHRRLTHERPEPGEIDALCRQFREGIAPIEEAGRLGGVLIQFPWNFEDTPSHRDLLERLAEGLHPLNLFVEVRHKSFLARSEEGGLPFLGDLGLNFANIDLPRSGTAPPPTCINTGPMGYFRLHGRNSSTWFDPKAGRDAKYDYLYSIEELRDLLAPMLRLAERTQVTYVIANNHFRGQAPANALQLMRLSGRPPPELPETLQAEFPFLRDM